MGFEGVFYFGEDCRRVGSWGFWLGLWWGNCYDCCLIKGFVVLSLS